MKTDIFYTVHTADETLSSGYALNEWSGLNNQTRGETATFELHFPRADEILVVESGETYTVESGTTEIWASTDVKENGTLNVEEGGTLITTGGDNVDTFQQYADHAGDFATFETLNNTQKYREQIPSDADVSSILLGFEPSPELQNQGVNGVWGLVTSGSDIRPQALTDNRYQIEVRILAEYQDYSDRTALENDLLI